MGVSHLLELSPLQQVSTTVLPVIDENANRLHLKWTDFNSSTHVTVYAECIYVFYQNLVLVAEYYTHRSQILQKCLL